MALLGAEMLLYPTAIGSEPPPAPPIDSRLHWQRTQQGHAAANLMPLIASNRIGTEHSRQHPRSLHIRFYGSSFITDASGAMLAEADQESESVITASFDLDALQTARDDWFVFRDRRPELYGPLASLSGRPPRRNECDTILFAVRTVTKIYWRIAPHRRLASGEVRPSGTDRQQRGALPRQAGSVRGRRERAAGAKVDLGILPRLLGYNLRRAAPAGLAHLCQLHR